jgi:SRSO17 transposase
MARRDAAGVPAQISFQTKPEIALEQIRWACEAGLPCGVLLLDAGYGNDVKLRSGIAELGRCYIAGIQAQTLVWAPHVRPGRPPKKGRHGEPNVISVKEAALALPAKAWRTIKWREGTNEWLSSRFARVRVCVASSHRHSNKPTREWLLIEWPEKEGEPTKYWLSTLPKSISFHDLVDAAKLRWRIERDYLELKQEVGLGHYEGRRWRGFHHHATLCIAAYGFLISERETIPPSEPRSSSLLQAPALPNGYRPRGSALAA